MYFPKSQIKTNLYTSGKSNLVLYLDNNYTQLYIGYYYEIYNGKKYTGKEPGDGENVLLYEFPINTFSKDPKNDRDLFETINPKLNLREIYFESVDIEENSETDLNLKYAFLNSKNPPPRTFNPQSFTTLPTPQNYQEGKFTRYFTKKTNELKYKEISEDTYKKLKNRDEQIAWDLYEPEKIEWEISGNKQIIARNNKQKVIKTEQNRRWYGFSKFLKEDYTKYWKP
jgi:hypothetical protein